MNPKLKGMIAESLSSVLPITLIVLALSFTIIPVSITTLLLFIMGAAMLIVGMGLFNLGVETAMSPMGEMIGTRLTKFKKPALIACCFFLIGVIVTVAEPDLQVLASQMAAVPDPVIILTVALGVGIFLALAFLRVLFQIPLAPMLIVCYLIVFLLAFFVPGEFLPAAFDSGGVTTGPITVPFILALGVGITAIRVDSAAEDDSFGLVALASIGPILSMMILGLIYGPTTANYTTLEIPELASTQDLWAQFAAEFPDYIREVAVALLPIILFFFIFQSLFVRLRRRPLIKILIGILYAFAGLSLFLTGVNVGFMPAGYQIGRALALYEHNWILIPIGMLVGFFLVRAEPAVAVLNHQVEEVSGGVVSHNAMNNSLSIGVALSVGLALLRVLTGLSIFWLILPGYAVALALSFVTPKLFTAIAFDSGGVASGPLTATFLLPLAMGACDALGGNILTDAFGVVAMVAMTPLITIQLLGLRYRLKTHRAAQLEEDEIIDLEPEEVSRHDS